MIEPCSSNVSLSIPSTCSAVDVSDELEDRDAVGCVFELMYVAEAAVAPQHPLGGLQNLHHLLAALVRLEYDGAAEARVLGEQVAAALDGG